MSRLLKTMMAGAALLAAPMAASAQEDDQGGWHVATKVPPIGPGDRIHGPVRADISVIVWLDPECPYCKQFGTTAETAIDNARGKANLAVRLFPLPFHGPNAMFASLSALCVGEQGGDPAYYRYLDGWLARTATNGAGLPAEPGQGGDPAIALATAAGARDTAALASCTAAPATAERLNEEMRGAQRAGLAGTPSIAVRNNLSGRTIMVDGAVGADDLEAAIAYMGKQSAL
ncbi:DsbA family protein [Novosphingobium fuchskuhlense]|uniref:DsbA family protein n=1 Tax=Novosphingobium fuchskuhlense TaxID=1117702 RepID=UPI000A6ABD7C|nr:thioredoxin domain-containing protein [Novosphingobium fuchskuhlense]